MNCPKCGYQCTDFDRRCPSCQYELPVVNSPVFNPLSSKNNIDYEGGFLDAVLHSSGRALKFLAKFVLVVGVIASFIMAIVMFTRADGLRGSSADIARWNAILYLVLGPIVSYLSALSTYAIGYIFEKVDEIDSKIK